MPLTAGQYVLRKLPHITALFWAIKILATTLGETAGDYFSQTLGLGTLRAAALLLAIFLVAVTIQLRASRFHPALFWTVVVLTSTAGTTISDFINYTSGLGQATGALILGSGLALVLLVWWRSGQTLNVEKVATRTGEVLFWIAVVFSTALARPPATTWRAGWAWDCDPLRWSSRRPCWCCWPRTTSPISTPCCCSGSPSS
jgi:uncharacterized membrane-anchored protein